MCGCRHVCGCRHACVGGGVGMCVGVGMCAWLTFESDVELGACVAANLVASIAMMMFNGRTPTSLVTRTFWDSEI